MSKTKHTPEELEITAKSIKANVEICADWIRGGETNHGMPSVNEIIQLIENGLHYTSLQTENEKLRTVLLAAQELLEAVEVLHPKSQVVPPVLKAIKAAPSD